MPGSLLSCPGRFAKAPDSSPVAHTQSRYTHRCTPAPPCALGSTHLAFRQVARGSHGAD